MQGTGIQFGDNEYFIGLVADGAEVLLPGGTGAQIACDTILSGIASPPGTARNLSEIPAEDVERWISAARDAIAGQSRQEGKPLREFACTLIGCVIANDHALYFQIGDGGIVIREESGYHAVFWPDQGEYANTTYFITDEAFLSHLSLLRSDIPPCEIALFTDGLQNLVLSFSQKTAHTGFFKPLFETLQKSCGGENLCLQNNCARFSQAVRSMNAATMTRP